MVQRTIRWLEGPDQPSAVTLEAISLFRNLAVGKDGCRVLGGAGVLPVLLEAMKREEADPAVQEQGLGAIAALVRQNRPLCDEISASGPIQQLAAAMKLHATELGCQQRGCAAFATVVEGAGEPTEVSHALHAAGGIEAILEAMGRHPGDLSTQRHLLHRELRH